MNSVITRNRKFAGLPGVLWFIGVFLAAGLAFLVAQPLAIQHLAKQGLKVTPYTLTLESYDYESLPQGRRFQTETVARRSDGALVQAGIILDPSGKELSVTRKIVTPDGHIISVADRISEYINWPTLSAEQIAGAKQQLLNPPKDCMLPGRTLVETGTVLGHPVVALRLPHPKNVVTTWVAPDLSCEKLQTRIESLQPDGSYKVSGETRALNLIIGEPDPALFELPSTYVSVKPSELMRREFDRIGAVWDDKAQHGADMADANYFGQPQTRKTQPAAASSDAGK